MGLNSETAQNQVAVMKKLVKQTKVNVIHKLTREAKKLREKKGTEEQKKKNEKKANRFIEEVMIIKKLQPDDVSKFALKTENCGHLVSDMKTSIDIKVLARLGAHKPLSTSVDKFRSDNPSWKEEIGPLLENLPVQVKQTVKNRSTPKKSPSQDVVRTPGNNIFSVTPVKVSGVTESPKKAQENKSKRNKKDLKMRQKFDNMKTQVIDDKKFEKQEHDRLNGGRDSPIAGTDFNEVSSPTNFNEKKRKRNKIELSLNHDSSGDDEDSDGGSISSSKNKKPKTHKSSIPEFGGLGQLNKDLDEIEQRLKKKNVPSKKDAQTKAAVIEESVDPFFVTTDGEEYKSSVPIPEFDDRPPIKSFSSDTSTPKEFYRKGKKITPSFHGHQKNFGDRNRNSFHNDRGRMNSFPERNNSYRNQNRGNSFADRNNSHPDGNSSFNDRSRNNSFNDRSRNNSFNDRSRNNSFNDKSRNNSFNDRNRNNSFNKGNNRNSFNRSPNERNKFDRNLSKPSFQKHDSSNSEKMHPSWEAKKKLSTLAQFQGKKTVFNE